MAAVRIEECAFSDWRFERLAQLMGWGRADFAIGVMARVWRQCTLENTHVLSTEDVDGIMGEGGAANLLVARLGKPDPKGVRISGAEGRVEWLDRVRKNGQLGGRPRLIK